MLEPFAACNGGPVGPARLSNWEAGTTDTWAPVSIRKRRPEISSLMKSCVPHGPTAVMFTAGPEVRFPGSC